MTEQAEPNAAAPKSPIIAWVFAAFLIGAGLLVLILAGIAFFEITLGIQLYALGADDGAPGGASSVVVAHVLNGVELLFLAPLPYLIVDAVGSYLRHVATRSKEMQGALHDLKGLERMTTSLMIAVIAADLVQRTLSPSGLTQTAALFDSLAIVVLSLYLLVLERGPRA